MTTPRERPIIFTSESVRAILAGTKTQSRRVMKPQPYTDVRQSGLSSKTKPCHVWEPRKSTAWFDWGSGFDPMIYLDGPYQPGDKLWVRETWRVLGWDEEFSGAMIQYRDGTRLWNDFPDALGSQAEDHWQEWLFKEVDRIAELPGVRYSRETELYEWDSDDVLPWKSPLFMPRWASRIMLEITDVRVELVQDISEEDAKAEGVWKPGEPVTADMKGYYGTTDYTARNQFMHTWEAINFDRGYGWNSNPWVWIIAFHLLT